MNRRNLSNRKGLPRWWGGKESACQCRRHKFNSWAGEIPWRRKWQPSPVPLLENPMNRAAWRATVHRITESDTAEHAREHTHTHTHTHTHAHTHSHRPQTGNFMLLPNSTNCLSDALHIQIYCLIFSYSFEFRLALCISSYGYLLRFCLTVCGRQIPSVSPAGFWGYHRPAMNTSALCSLLLRVQGFLSLYDVSGS